MSTSLLARHLSDYLAMRRALGFKLERSGALMAQFVGYLDSIGATVITVDAALAWATRPEGASRYWWSTRLAAARLFAQYMINFDPATEVPRPTCCRRPVCGRRRSSTPQATSRR